MRIAGTFGDGWRGLRAAARVILDFILPPRCLACGAMVGDDAGLCAACWSRLRFIEAPLCQRCGAPFELPAPGASVCASCLARAPAFDRARAAFAYDDDSKALVLRLKHGDRLDAAAALGRLMARAGAELLAEADLVTAVPLHRWRLFHRRFNQAAVLARAAAKAARAPGELVPDLLVRRRATPIQGGLGRLGRRRNVAGAFAPRPGAKARIKGRRVLLVDDVHTTGATLEECARVLKRAGAARVDVLTLARVLVDP